MANCSLVFGKQNVPQKTAVLTTVVIVWLCALGVCDQYPVAIYNEVTGLTWSTVEKLCGETVTVFAVFILRLSNMLNSTNNTLRGRSRRQALSQGNRKNLREQSFPRKKYS